jgi:cytochrome c
MSRLEWISAAAFLAAVAGASAQETRIEPNFGAPVSQAELARFLAIPPRGAGLPPGRGDVAQGKAIYEAKCAACHGDHLQGVKETGGATFLGGRDTLASAKPVKTVESYWPYATTIFDYVRRAMPFNAPGSLTDDEVYAVTAFLLASGHIVPEDAVLDAATLPRVEMPNRKGFFPDPRPK